MGSETEEEPVWCPRTIEHLVGGKIVSLRKTKNTKTIPLKVVGRGGEPKWARGRRYRRKAGRLGADELGLERSSMIMLSKRAEGSVVVWVRSVGVAK